MKTLQKWLRELAWIAGALVLAWFFPRTVLSIMAIGALITIVLQQVERGWK